MFNPVAWFIAKRYLFSKKSHSVVNFISVISVIAIAVPAAAMVILLSVTNGFIDFAKKLNDTFDPNIKISLKEGVYFDYNMPFIDALWEVDNVKGVTQYIESDCIISSDDESKVITLRGIDSIYLQVFPIETAIIDGKYNKFNMLLGSGVARTIGYGLGVSGEVTLYSPVMSGLSLFGLNRAFNSDKISVSGVFMLDIHTNNKYAIAPIEFTQTVMQRKGKVSAIGVAVSSLEDIEKCIEKIKEIVPDNFIVKDRFEQRALDYAIIKQEKAAIYIMLVFIMVVASLTLVCAVIMMMIEKREQMHIIGTMGANEKLKRSIFRYQSFAMTFFGGFLGVFVGLVVVLLQQYFGIIKINVEAVLTDTYPVLLDIYDILMVLGAIVVVGYLISMITTSSMVSDKISKKENNKT